MSSSDEEILDLVARLQAGIDVDDSFRRLFEVLRPRLVAFFLRYRFTNEESHDLTQETLFRVFKGIGTFRRESRFERWLFEIAGNVYRNELRRRGAVKRDGHDESLDAAMERDSASDRPAVSLPRSGSDPLAEASRRSASKRCGGPSRRCRPRCAGACSCAWRKGSSTAATTP